MSVPVSLPTGNTVALAGNPNVGKSTVFNALTGLRQHTGNWPGKTVGCAVGVCKTPKREYTLVDLPGCYSLLSNSAEEEVARDYLYYGAPRVCVVVCDATALERNLIMALQVMELTANVVVCVNLMDEAKRKGIRVDTDKLSALLGVPVVAAAAGQKRGLDKLTATVERLWERPLASRIRIDYGIAAQRHIEPLCDELKRSTAAPRWTAVRLLEGESETVRALYARQPNLPKVTPLPDLSERVTRSLVAAAEWLAGQCVRQRETAPQVSRADRWLTGKWTAFPLMLGMLAIVFWLTMQGANYPSAWLQKGLFWLEEKLYTGTLAVGAPMWLAEMLWHGVYRVTAWVVSVMLPPMAIFFPLFTLAEDVGLLPRVAFNLDRGFACCNACGKQSLCMMMGLGCNAAGVVGCRIIDSPRERLIAMLTNVFMPCNGRFPTLIALIAMFFAGSSALSSLWAALWLAGLIVLGVAATLLCSKVLSMTVLRGTPGHFALELPPFRRPRIGQILVRSVMDRTLFVLGRAVCVAAPAGLVIWCLANLQIGGQSWIALLSSCLNPVAVVFGMDGMILLAFLLGLPANEIVLPLILLGYQGGATLTQTDSLPAVRDILIANGWEVKTALCVMLFCLMHFPCSTTLATIHKESGSWKWTALAAVLPTVFGLTCCLVCNLILS